MDTFQVQRSRKARRKDEKLEKKMRIARFHAGRERKQGASRTTVRGREHARFSAAESEHGWRGVVFRRQEAELPLSVRKKGSASKRALLGDADRTSAAPKRRHVRSESIKITSEDVRMEELKRGIQDDEEEIVRLERKLHLNKRKRKGDGRLGGQFEADGLEELLVGLDDLSEYVRSRPGGGEARGGGGQQDDWDEEEDEEQDEEDEEQELKEGVEQGDEDVMEGGGLREVELKRNSASDDPVLETGGESKGTRAAGQKTQHAGLARSADESQAVGTYLPPHLRRARAAGSSSSSQIAASGLPAPSPRTYKSEGRVSSPNGMMSDRVADSTVSTAIRACLNRVAEQNIVPVALELLKLFRTHGIGDSRDALWAYVLQTLENPRVRTGNLLQPLSAVIEFLHRAMPGDFGARILEALVHRTEAALANKLYVESANCVRLLCYLHLLQLASSKLVFELADRLAITLELLDVQILLVILGESGWRLRKEDPARLRGLIVSLRERAAELLGVNVASVARPALGSEDDGVDVEDYSSRLRFLLEELVELKNNTGRMRAPAVDEVPAMRLHKLTRNILRQRKLGESAPAGPLRVGWKDLLEANRTGRWWIVGSAWAGAGGLRDSRPSGAHASTRGGGDNRNDGGVGGDASVLLGPLAAEIDSKVWEAAREQRLGSSVRRAIFAALMSARDFEVATERLRAVRLSKVQQREIPVVLVECCLRERLFNLFYPLVAARLCIGDKSMAHTLRLHLWDSFRAIDAEVEGHGTWCEGSRIDHYARFFAEVVRRDGVSLAVFKGVDVLAARAPGLRFLHAFWAALLPGLSTKLDRVRTCGRVGGSTSRDVQAAGEALAIYLRSTFIPGLPREDDVMLRSAQHAAELLEGVT